MDARRAREPRHRGGSECPLEGAGCHAAARRESPYAEQRAREIHSDKLSREIYDKLLAECPDSVEAKRYAAYWSIPDPQKDDQGNETTLPEGVNFADDTEINQIGYEFSDYGSFNVTSKISNSDGEDNNVWKAIVNGIGKLHDEARKGDVERMRKEIDDLAKKARDNRSFIEELTTLNFLDDMALFTREKGVTPGMLRHLPRHQARSAGTDQLAGFPNDFRGPGLWR